MSAVHGGNVWQGAGPEQWLDYSANIRPEGTPDWVTEAMMNAMKNARYYPDLSMKGARKGLAEFLNIDEKFVVPTSGGASAIDAACGCGAKKVVLGAPCFSEYRAAAEKRGIPVEEVSLIAENRTIADPSERLEPYITEGCLVWICSPMNPVGYCFKYEEVKKLLSLVESRNAKLAVDEAFIDFCPDMSVRSLIKSHPALMITGSMTKILGIPGVRLGYLLTQDAENFMKDKLPWELNCFAEAVAEELPKHRSEMEFDAELSDECRNVFETCLASMGIALYPSFTNFVLADFGRDVDPIIEKLKEKNILVRRCMDFHGVNDGKHLRLAVKDHKTNAVFLETLKEILRCVENR